MQLRKLFEFVAALFLVSLYLAGQTGIREKSTPSDRDTLRPGVVVEQVGKESEGAKAGLQKGDILLAWNRGEIQGTIESPFDMYEIEVEQEPRGTVTLHGIRGEERWRWTMGSNVWGFQVRPNLDESLLSLYLAGREAGQPAEAAERWKRAAAEAIKSQDRRLWLASWLLAQAADALARAEKWRESDELYEEAIQEAASAGPAIVAQFFHAWAITYNWRSDWDAAEKYYLKAVEYERRAYGNDTLVSARDINNIGYVGWNRGDLTKAEKYYDEGLGVRKKLAPESLPVAASLENRANVAEERGDYATAGQYYAETLAIREKLIPGSLDIARTLNNLGIAAKDQGEFDKAERYYRRALDFQERLAPGSSFAATLNDNLGSLAYARGDLDKAEEHFIAALAIKKKLEPDSARVADSLNDLGTLAESRGEYARAEQYYRESLAVQQALLPDSLQVARTLANLGDTCRKLGNLIQAEEYLLRALTISTKQAPDGDSAGAGLNSLGDVARDRGDLAKAAAYYRRSLAIREKIGPASWERVETLGALAGIMRQNSQLDAAAHLYLEAVNVLESQMAHLGGSEDIRSGFRARYAGYYQEYIDLLIAQRKPELAFQVLERARARGLLETLAAARVDIHKGAEPALLRQERALQQSIQAQYGQRIRLLNDKNGKSGEQQLLAVDNELKNLLARYHDVEGLIRSASPAYAALTQPQPLPLQQIQRELLDAGTVLLEYSLGEERSYVFAVSSESIAAYALPKRAQIEAAARPVYDALTARARSEKGETEARRMIRINRAESEYPRAAMGLSRILLEPIASLIRGKRLLIVSDGILQYVPFAALPIPGERATFVPLVAEHEIVTLPSASVLQTLRQQRATRTQAPKEVMVLADPVFTESDARVKTGSERKNAGEARSDDSFSRRTMLRSAIEVGAVRGGILFPRLIFTRREADAILRQTSPGAGRRSVDFQASRATATSTEIAQYRIVHFATHSLLNSEHPELSGLVLSLVDERGQSQDGFLMLHDIYNLDLSADMVVLSACETALGKDIQGEGMVGITRGFMYAGASRVVASLWKVDDAATAELMSRFYRGILREGLQPSVALRKAQMALWKQKRWSFPYYWAGFVMQGE